jgi:hypothetical protein
MDRRTIQAVMLLAFVSTTVVAAQGNPSLFLVDGTFQGLWTRIFQVNPDTGALQLRADLGTAYTPMLGMAAASGTTLYLTGTDLGPENLCQGDIACLLIRVELDPLSTTPSLVQIIGTLTVGGVMLPGITGLTFRNDGRLYAVSQTTGGLYTIDLVTAQATLIGIVDIPVNGGDITFDGSDRLWLWANIGPGSGIYQLDPETAHATAFDLLPGLDLAGMAALGHGEQLRGASAGTDRLYVMDTTVGLTGVNYRLKLNGVDFDHSRGDLDSPFCESDDACADENVCTTDQCEPGGCNHPAVPDGNGCSDGDLCTQVDNCQSGTCTGTSPVICTATDECHDPGTCDQATGVCGVGPEKPNGTQCNDGNACTQGDSCQSGVCQPGPPTDLDGDGHPDLLCGGNDCLDTNPFVWGVPFEVTNLQVGPGNSPIMTWDSQNAQAGPGTVFDLSSGTLSDLRSSGFSSSTCLQGGGGNSFTDTRPDPVVGGGYWYLTRATNACGVGTFGSSARDSGITACP